MAVVLICSRDPHHLFDEVGPASQAGRRSVANVDEGGKTAAVSRWVV